MKEVFKMPVPVKIKGRSSSITNAFVNGIIPTIEPTDEQIDEVLGVLGMNRDTICCAYCGDGYTEWDHFRPLIFGKKPTGYISEIYNLVPACGKCNQSKGNRNWKEWMYSDAKLSPHSRGILDIDERAQHLELFQKKYDDKVKVVDFENTVGSEKWEAHWNNHKKIMKLFDDSQTLSDEIRAIIKAKVIDNVDNCSGQ